MQVKLQRKEVQKLKEAKRKAQSHTLKVKDVLTMEIL